MRPCPEIIENAAGPMFFVAVWAAWVYATETVDVGGLGGLGVVCVSCVLCLCVCGGGVFVCL